MMPHSTSLILAADMAAQTDFVVVVVVRWGSEKKMFFPVKTCDIQGKMH